MKEESISNWITGAGSAFHTRTVAGKRVLVYGHLSERKALDTSGHDLICFRDG